MTFLTVEEQLDQLKKTGSGQYLSLARPAGILITAGLLVAGAVSQNPAFYAIAVPAGVITLVIWLVTPHLQNAARGATEGLRQPGTVEILVRPYQDSEREYTTYSGRIAMDGRPLWQMQFAQPDGWEPQAGVQPVQLVYIRGVNWPVLLIFSQGLLYPGSSPKRLF